MPESLTKGERIGQICIQEGLITPEQLDEALNIQKNKGGRIGWILSSMGYIKRIELFRVLSQHYSLKFATPDFDRIKKTIDKSLFQRITREEILDRQAIPYQMTGEGTLILLNSYPGTEKTKLFFKERFEVNEIEEWVITDLDLVDLVQTVYAEKLADDSIFGLFYREPDESDYRVFSSRQVVFFAVLTQVVKVLGEFYLFIHCKRWVF